MTEMSTTVFVFGGVCLTPDRFKKLTTRIHRVSVTPLYSKGWIYVLFPSGLEMRLIEPCTAMSDPYNSVDKHFFVFGCVL